MKTRLATTLVVACFLISEAYAQSDNKIIVLGVTLPGANGSTASMQLAAIQTYWPAPGSTNVGIEIANGGAPIAIQSSTAGLIADQLSNAMNVVEDQNLRNALRARALSPRLPRSRSGGAHRWRGAATGVSRKTVAANRRTGTVAVGSRVSRARRRAARDRRPDGGRRARRLVLA